MKCEHMSYKTSLLIHEWMRCKFHYGVWRLNQSFDRVGNRYHGKCFGRGHQRHFVFEDCSLVLCCHHHRGSCCLLLVAVVDGMQKHHNTHHINTNKHNKTLAIPKKPKICISVMGRFSFTLDVLTDGSEHTGYGTLFLSVWKQPKYASSRNVSAVGENQSWLRQSMDIQPPVARYAISGLGDGLSRLAADQRFKLANTRAVFLPTFVGCTDGLSSLLLALHTAGSSSLHVVTPEEEEMEELSTIILGKHKNLNILTCQVPKVVGPDEIEGILPAMWWKVYSDEYVTVHARWTSFTSVLYLYTLCHEGNFCTIALFPPGTRDILSLYEDMQAQQLPILDDARPVSIDFVIGLNPFVVPNPERFLSRAGRSLPFFMVTVPNYHDGGGGGSSGTNISTTIDRGLLIRSQNIARYLRHELPGIFPPIFKNYQNISEKQQQGEQQQCVYSGVDGTPAVIRLKSCTSVILDVYGGLKSWIMDRRKVIEDRPLSEEWDGTVESLRKFHPPRQQNTFSVETLDENEIDIDDDDEDDDENGDETSEDMEDANTFAVFEPSEPHLVVLGTGCASPSAVRGASGYAVIFPNNDASNPSSETLLLDAGEGITTMMSRSLPDMVGWERTIRGIWISHGHLDHYGGLPNLLRLINSSQYQRPRRGGKHSKMQKIERSVPWIMAPPKVLRYLDIVLQCQNGYSRVETSNQLFIPRWHKDPTIPPGPWIHFEPILVDHKCWPSYGLLLGWNGTVDANETYTTRTNKWLCFSGDTRPCPSLVRACRRAVGDRNHKKKKRRVSATSTTATATTSTSTSVSPSPSSSSSSSSSEGSASTRTYPNLFLLHEATFADQEIEQAKRKKHSTISEAIKVASDVCANRLLLTHFSQRYTSLPTSEVMMTTTTTDTDTNNAMTDLHLNNNNNNNNNNATTIPLGLAMDGLRIPL